MHCNAIRYLLLLGGFLYLAGLLYFVTTSCDRTASTPINVIDKQADSKEIVSDPNDLQGRPVRKTRQEFSQHPKDPVIILTSPFSREEKHPDDPVIEKHTVISYSPFLLIPEMSFSVPPVSRLHKIFPVIENWYTSHSGCTQENEYCYKPQLLLNNYSTRYNSSIHAPIQIDGKMNTPIFVDPKRLMGHIHVLHNITMPIFIRCGQNKDQYHQAMSFRPEIRMFRLRKRSKTDGYPKKVLHLNGPLFYAAIELTEQFQHIIIDGIAKLIQGWDILQDPTVYISVRQSNKSSLLFYDFLELFNVNRSRVLNVITLMESNDHFAFINAPKTYLSCQAPILHPYLWIRARKLLKLPRPSTTGPQNVIIYLTRRPSKALLNGGRNMMNEEKIIELLRGYFEPSHEVMIFESRNYSRLSDIMELFSRAALVIGPHGGAFCNIFFSPSTTVVIEFFPSKKQFWTGPFRVFWYWLATMLNQPYTFIIIEKTTTNKYNMFANLTEINELLNNLRHYFPLLPPS